LGREWMQAEQEPLIKGKSIQMAFRKCKIQTTITFLSTLQPMEAAHSSYLQRVQGFSTVALLIFWIRYCGIVVCIWNAPHGLMYWGLGYQLMGFWEATGSQGIDLISGWIPWWRMAFLGSGKNRRWASSCLEETGHWEHALVPWPSFPSLPPVCHEVSGFALLHAPWHSVLPNHGPASNGTKGTWAKGNRSSFKLFLLGTCHSDKRISCVMWCWPLPEQSAPVMTVENVSTCNPSNKGR
jgi:hypothetical protein